MKIRGRAGTPRARFRPARSMSYRLNGIYFLSYGVGTAAASLQYVLANLFNQPWNTTVQ